MTQNKCCFFFLQWALREKIGAPFREFDRRWPRFWRGRNIVPMFLFLELFLLTWFDLTLSNELSVYISVLVDMFVEMQTFTSVWKGCLIKLLCGVMGFKSLGSLWPLLDLLWVVTLIQYTLFLLMTSKVVHKCMKKQLGYWVKRKVVESHSFNIRELFVQYDPGIMLEKIFFLDK